MTAEASPSGVPDCPGRPASESVVSSWPSRVPVFASTPGTLSCSSAPATAGRGSASLPAVGSAAPSCATAGNASSVKRSDTSAPNPTAASTPSSSLAPESLHPASTRPPESSARCCSGGAEGHAAADRAALAAPERRPGLVARALIAIIRGYQRLISPLLPPACRFWPTCSQYAIESLAVHGPGRGSWLALRRLLRCHPFHPGGIDPVPGRDRSPRRGAP